MRPIILSALLGLSSILAIPQQTQAASGLELNPATACAALKSAHLDAGSYKDMGGGRYQCFSHRRQLPFGEPNQNEVSYRASGDRAHVRRIELNLDVYSKRELQPTLGRMRDLGDRLVQELLGKPLDVEIANTLLAASSGEW